jgi:hypothetical protein
MGHQNISAGLAAFNLYIARNPAVIHMERINRNTVTALVKVIGIGMNIWDSAR